MYRSSQHLWLFGTVIALVCLGTRSNTAAVSSPNSHEDQEYGIGFDFTPAYGAVAVSFANGSNIALGRVDGDRAWHDLMYKLAIADYSTGHNDNVETDRAILLEMIRSLVAVGGRSLGEPIRAATVSLPAHTRVHHDHEFSTDLMIRDAFAAANLEFVKVLGYTAQGEPLLFAENSILAGHGLSLCPNYTDDYLCSGARHYDAYYLVGYYSNALEVTRTAEMWSAYGPWHYPYPNHTLGTDARKTTYPDEEQYWKAVRDHLGEAIYYPLRANITKVVMYGDHGNNARLRQEVRKVLDDMYQDPEWVDGGLDPTFVGALGAAEFVKRQPYAKLPFISATGGLVVQPKRDL